MLQERGLIHIMIWITCKASLVGHTIHMSIHMSIYVYHTNGLRLCQFTLCIKFYSSLHRVLSILALFRHEAPIKNNTRLWTSKIKAESEESKRPESGKMCVSIDRKGSWFWGTHWGTKWMAFHSDAIHSAAFIIATYSRECSLFTRRTLSSR